MPIVTERVFLTVDTGDQAVELELTQAVDQHDVTHATMDLEHVIYSPQPGERWSHHESD